MRVILRRFTSVLALFLVCALFVFNTAFASSTDSTTDAHIEDISTESGDNYIRYPQLAGMDDTPIQNAVNDAIVNEAGISQRLITLSMLQPGGTGLQVSYTAYLHDMLFSTAISAKGVMENQRNGHVYTALSYDLKTGTRLTMSDFFLNPQAAQAWMEEQLTSTLEDDLSTYLLYAELTPLPLDNFSFDQNGITFYYPYHQFSLLSEYSGAVQFQYGELQNFLIREEGSVPVRLGAIVPEYTDAEIKTLIEAQVSQGTLPGINVQLGDSISDLISAYRLPGTPDQFPGGRYFQFEDAAFRQILILSDALTSGYESSVVQGILARRMNLYGIQIGVTEQSRWREILGEPWTVDYDAYTAADYGLPVGTADYYTFEDTQLMLYADESGVLYAVQLKK